MNNQAEAPGSKETGDEQQGCCVRGMSKDVTGRMWRGGRDSNPRGDCSPSGLANRRTRPTMRPPRVVLDGGGGGIRTHGPC